MTDAEAIDELHQDNQRRITELAAAGVGVGGFPDLAVKVWLEHVLQHVGGDEGVRAAQLDMEGRISHALDDAEKQIEKAKQRQAAERLGVVNGHLAAPRGVQP